ncbi:uncharacterized protein LOC116111258 [Pistacia vera]|uniref:uncharacterized protein LOC116111258 n=1 Tax=Pistacia vera TaxID=55513 RepID=UPI001263CA39|nr:uncharacterized protein LOC116111258 [Pistacia vera]
MQAMWVSLKENVKCRTKLNDVVKRQQKCSKTRSRSRFGKENWQYNQLHEMRNPIPVPEPVPEVLFKLNYPRTQFYNINIGDLSRNIIETIFLKALMDPSKPLRKIETVLKVKHRVETLERFEKYREKVKKKAYVQYTGHPRSTVDGNELLRFYGTVITCSERLTRVSDLCKDPFCRVCRIIQYNFDTEYLKKNGIRMSSSSEELCDINMIALTKLKNIKRAVIVCRTIAGRVANEADKIPEKCDSFRSRGLDSNSDNLIVTNACAVLPCFVVVFT